MNVFIYNTLCSKKTFAKLFLEYNVKGAEAPQKFYSLLAHGLVECTDVNVFVTSLLPINSKEQRKWFWNPKNEEEDKIRFKYIPLLNVPILRNFFVGLYVFFEVVFRKFPPREENIVLVDYLRFSINLSVLIACKFRNIKILVVITDMPGLDVRKTLLGSIRDLFIFGLKYDYYVCLTDHLNRVLNPSQKPSLIIEGFADNDLRLVDNTFDLST